MRLGAFVALASLALPSVSVAQQGAVPAPAAATPTPATAGPASSPEDPHRMAEAREHFEAGLHHYEARQFREAIREFELSNSLVPSADLAYNIARCHEQIDALDVALEYYERYLREKIDPPDKAEVERKIAWLREQIESRRLAGRTRATTGLLRLSVAPAGATIAVDGRPVGTAPLAAPLTLPPGSHRLDVVAPGRQDFVARVEVRGGDTTQAIADLPPATAHEAVRGGRLWTWVAGGAAVACLVGGIVLGVGAQSTMADAQATYDDGDPDTAHTLAGEARAQANRADYLFGGALVLGITSVVLYFVEGSAVSTETHPAVAAR